LLLILVSYTPKKKNKTNSQKIRKRKEKIYNKKTEKRIRELILKREKD